MKLCLARILSPRVLSCRRDNGEQHSLLECEVLLSLFPGSLKLSIVKVSRFRFNLLRSTRPRQHSTQPKAPDEAKIAHVGSHTPFREPHGERLGAYTGRFDLILNEKQG